MKKVPILIAIMMAAAYMLSTATFGASDCFRFKNNGHDTLIIGEIISIDASETVIRAEGFIVSASEHGQDRQLRPEIARVVNGNWTDRFQVGDYVIASLYHQRRDRFEHAWGIYRVDSLDYRTLRVDTGGRPWFSAELTDFVNSGGRYFNHFHYARDGLLVRRQDGANVVILDMPEPAPVPHPYIIELSDGLAFHMTPPEYETLGYLPSGHYRGNNLLYAVDQYIAQEQIFLAKDGMTFLVVSRLPDCDTSPAVSFYDRGVLARVYTALDLVENSEMIARAESRILWTGIWLRHTPVDNTLQLRPLGGDRLTFDLTTGMILPQPEPPEINVNLPDPTPLVMRAIWSAVLMLLILLAGLIIVILRIKSLRSK